MRHLRECCIVLNSFKGSLVNDVLNANLLNDVLNVVSYSVEMRLLNNAPLSFRYNVIKSGKPIAVVDDDARTEFEESTLNHYFDFSPFRKMYLKETLGHGI